MNTQNNPLIFDTTADNYLPQVEQGEDVSLFGTLMDMSPLTVGDITVTQDLLETKLVAITVNGEPMIIVGGDSELQAAQCANRIVNNRNLTIFMSEALQVPVELSTVIITGEDCFELSKRYVVVADNKDDKQVDSESLRMRLIFTVNSEHPQIDEWQAIAFMCCVDSDIIQAVMPNAKYIPGFSLQRFS